MRPHPLTTLVFLSALACGGDPVETGTPSGESGSEAGRRATAPRGRVDRQDRFHAAREGLPDAPRRAATRLREVATGLERAADDETDGGDFRRRAASTLERTAQDVEAGALDSPGALDPVFARVDLLLARHHLERVQTLAERGETEAAAAALRNAADDLRNAIGWTGERPEIATGVAIDDARRAANAGTAPVRSIIDLEAAIGRVGRTLDGPDESP